MAYPFPQIKKEVFLKTFLKDVHVYFEYEKRKKINNEEIRYFCKEKFNVAVDKNTNFDEFSVNSKDNLVKFEFTTTHVVVKMDFLAYMNFNCAQKYISILLDYLTVIGVKKLSKVRFSKYNELKYKLPNDDSSVNVAMQQIFAECLLEYKTGERDFDSDSKSFDSLARWEKRIVFEEAKLDARVIIDYGFCEHTDSKKEGVLTLNIVAESINDVNVCDIETIIMKYNYDIDCAFQWSISNQVIAKMRKK